MKTFKSSDLTHKRAEVLKAAREEGVIIEERRSNGEVIERYELKKVKVSISQDEAEYRASFRGLAL